MPNTNTSLLSLLLPLAALAAVGSLPLQAQCSQGEDAATQTFRSCLVGWRHPALSQPERTSFAVRSKSTIPIF